MITQATEIVPAIVLRTKPFGEADLMVALLTPTYGKLETTAWGARRSRKRFPAGLSMGMRGQATLRLSHASPWSQLCSFESTAQHAAFGHDLERFAYVAYLCELTDQLVLARQAEPEIFAELCRSLERFISSTPLTPLELRRFELALLRLLGLLPQFAECFICMKPLCVEQMTKTVELGFDQYRGGLLCPPHSRQAPRIRAGVLHMAALLSHADISNEELQKLAQASLHDRRELRDLLKKCLDAHLRHPLRSSSFFAQLSYRSHNGTQSL